MRSQKGFTLVELIVVVAILGILAAVAVPRYIDAEQKARISAVNGLAGGLKGAVTMVRAHCMLNSCDGASVTKNVTIDQENIKIVVSSKSPTATEAGIGIAAQISGVDTAYANDDVGVATFRPKGATGNCKVTYNSNQGRVLSYTADC